MTTRLAAWVDSDRVSPRARGIAALVLSIPLSVGIWNAVFLWCPFASMDFLPFEWRYFAYCVTGGVATVAMVLLLLRGVRGRSGWRSTVSAWFGPKRIRSLALGLAFILPLPLAMVLVHGPEVLAAPSAFSIPFTAAAVLLSPIVEEVLFRGLLFGVLLREVRCNAWVGLVLTSLLFGAWHASFSDPFSRQSLVSVFLRVPLGAFLCWAYWKRAEDLCVPIGFHAGLNIAASFLELQGVKGDQWRLRNYWELVMLTLGLAYFVLRVLEERKDTVPDSTPPHSPAAAHSGRS